MASSRCLCLPVCRRANATRTTIHSQTAFHVPYQRPARAHCDGTGPAGQAASRLLRTRPSVSTWSVPRSLSRVVVPARDLAAISQGRGPSDQGASLPFQCCGPPSSLTSPVPSACASDCCRCAQRRDMLRLGLSQSHITLIDALPLPLPPSLSLPSSSKATTTTRIPSNDFVSRLVCHSQIVTSASSVLPAKPCLLSPCSASPPASPSPNYRYVPEFAPLPSSAA